jgi:hypothetical protein
MKEVVFSYFQTLLNTGSICREHRATVEQAGVLERPLNRHYYKKAESSDGKGDRWVTRDLKNEIYTVAVLRLFVTNVFSLLQKHTSSSASPFHKKVDSDR